MDNTNSFSAVGLDPLRVEGHFYSNDVNFVASALLQDAGIFLTAVDLHPQKQGIKVFYLSPVEAVQNFQRDYVSGRTLVDPSLLADKMNKLKSMSVTGKPQTKYFEKTLQVAKNESKP